MKILKIALSFILLLSLFGCFKSDICECSTFDSKGDFLFLVSTDTENESDCCSTDTFITESGDTNTTVCQTVLR